MDEDEESGGDTLPAVQVWKSDRSTVHVEKAWKPVNVLESLSIPILLSPEADDSPMSLPVFSSVTILAAGAQQEEDVQHCLLDGMGYCGGRIWAFDWQPNQDLDSEPDLDREQEYLAVSAHRLGHEQNIVGQPCVGTGAVQIWSVSQTADQGDEGELEMVMAILHEGAVAWDVQWCPNYRIYVADQVPGNVDYNLLGILAMALGNGEVHIISVPMPEEVQLDQGDYKSEFLAVTIEPSVLLTQDDLYGSIVSSIDWLPTSPHDLLLLGFWDGFVAIWQLPQGRRIIPQVLIYHRVEVLPIRKALWIKPPPQLDEPDDSFRYTFCTGGHSGVLNIWDMRNAFEPLFSKVVARVWLLDLATTSTPRIVYAALEDSTMRQVTFEATKFIAGVDNIVQTVRGHNDGAVWSITCSEKLGLAAFGGEDGDIGLFEISNDAYGKKKRLQLCAGSMKLVQEGLRVLTASEVANGTTYDLGTNFYETSKHTKGEAKVRTSEAQWIQRVRFSPNGEHTVWLAAGTGSGLLRVVRISK